MGIAAAVSGTGDPGLQVKQLPSFGRASIRKNTMQINWAIVPSLLALAAIFYMLLVPNKAMRERMRNDLNLADRKTARQYRRKVSEMIGISAISYERGEITGFVTNLTPKVVLFDGIIKGDYSQTLFLTVSSDGQVVVNTTEAEAQSVYQKGDFGIASVTMTDGSIQFRDILPNGVDPKNLLKLRFNFVTGSK